MPKNTKNNSTCCFAYHAIHVKHYHFLMLSRVVRKPAFCICENKDADQLRGNREADQRLYFRYIDSTISLVPKYEKIRASSHLVWLYSLVYVGPGRKPRRPVFSQRDFVLINENTIFMTTTILCFCLLLLDNLPCTMHILSLPMVSHNHSSCHYLCIFCLTNKQVIVVNI